MNTGVREIEVDAIARSPAGPAHRRRGWVARRILAIADLVGLAWAFSLAELFFAPTGSSNETISAGTEALLFVATLPLWLLVARLYGLYDRDEERTSHSTLDELLGVFHLVTVGAWILLGGAWILGVAHPYPLKVGAFWAFAILSICAARATARTIFRRHPTFIQNTLIVGGGDVGRLIARKYRQHPEYGIRLVGIVDPHPKDSNGNGHDARLFSAPERIQELVNELDVARVVVAFWNVSDETTIELIRSIRDLDVQIDVVPRLFEVLSPNAVIHSVEGLPLIGLPPARMSRSSRLIKRGFDIVAASVLLLLSAPLFALLACRIKRDSPGPVFFRQTRVGMDMREFTLLKFRTMRTDTDEGIHREYVKTLMRRDQAARPSGLFKLDQAKSVTPIGRWLRRTSLDEWPQLINVLRGDMSLVGPRPCIPYETEDFSPHHLERFLVPAGITGLWQVTARARVTYLEALDMDVAYVRGWSLGLDLMLLLRTPLQLLRRSGTA